MADIDLLGDPIVRRDAVFHGKGCRLVLSRDWGPGPRALAIGCNPSDASHLRDDPTSHWWNTWFRWAGFGGYDAMNVYPFITSSPAECRRIVDGIEGGDWDARDALHFVNLPLLVERAKAAHQVFVCWGNIAWDAVWLDHVVEAIQAGEPPYPHLWCWGLTQSGSPKHPLARGKHRIPREQQPILWRAA